ncbi:MAG: polysaccharide biosynthesis C-terminal domain-containing protein [Chitinophagaceae bacterium]|nr:polysaccharide biosynthesis C-terminal domain-containing protein [Chitinophagaceae bacterium]
MSLYTLVGVVNAGIGFFLLPVLTAYLTPEDYAVISLVNVYVSVLIPIVGLSTAGYITVEYYNPKLPKEQFPSVFSSVRVIPLFGILILSLVFFAGQHFLPPLMELPVKAYWLILPLTLFSLYVANFSSFLVATKRAALFTSTSFTKLAVEIGITLSLVIGIGMQWDGRIYSAFITAFVFTLLSVYFYRKWNLLNWDIRKDIIQKAIFFGTPLIMHQIGKFVINQSDRLFLAKMVSMDEMGIYSVGYQVGTLIMILVTAFSNFFSPYLYERLARNQDKDRREIVKMSYMFIGGILVALLILVLLTPFLFSIFINERYAGGANYVLWVGLGYVFWGVYSIFGGYVFYYKKTYLLGRLAIVNVALNFAFNYIFIKEYGAIGAAYATCLSYFLVALMMVFIVARKYPMPWMLKRR